MYVYQNQDLELMNIMDDIDNACFMQSNNMGMSRLSRVCVSPH